MSNNKTLWPMSRFMLRLKCWWYNICFEHGRKKADWGCLLCIHERVERRLKRRSEEWEKEREIQRQIIKEWRSR